LSQGDQPAALARKVIESNTYMTLGTADEAGRPWATPVYYAVESYSRFLWVSAPETKHSKNLAVRPEVSIVIFDSRAPLGNAEAVYMSARAEELMGSDLERGIEVFSRESQADGGPEWGLEDVQPPARLRLYRATAAEQFVLLGGDRREPVTL
jgi:uncharacterized protein YhbP (UPF0306 family)